MTPSAETPTLRLSAPAPPATETRPHLSAAASQRDPDTRRRESMMQSNASHASSTEASSPSLPDASNMPTAAPLPSPQNQSSPPAAPAFEKTIARSLVPAQWRNY